MIPMVMPVDGEITKQAAVDAASGKFNGRTLHSAGHGTVSKLFRSSPTAHRIRTPESGARRQAECPRGGWTTRPHPEQRPPLRWVEQGSLRPKDLAELDIANLSSTATAH